ncbi:hypothetical protein SMICM304S_01307 [Streptomyces microflavus]
MGSELPDEELYRQGSLKGGLAYTPEELRRVFSDLTEIELRRMHDEAPGSPVFGESFLLGGAVPQVAPVAAVVLRRTFGDGGRCQRPRLRGREATQARTVSPYQYGFPFFTWSGGRRPCLQVPGGARPGSAGHRWVAQADRRDWLCLSRTT